MRYAARAPLRVDFGGGWTDVPAYALAEGGAVLNAAITRYVRGTIARPEAEGMIRRLRGDRSYLSYSLDLPSGAGLGASAAQTVLWAALVKATIANVADRRQIAEMACGIAELLGIVGGKQDEYASALGGITYFTFTDQVVAERLELSPETTASLRSRLVLVYSGERRLSDFIHRQVWTRYREGDAGVIAALRNLKRLAGEMRDALVSREIDAFAHLLTENWHNQIALHPTVQDRALDEVFKLALQNGALGGKACGAGGGGCLLFLAREGETERLRDSFRQSKLQVFDFDFDTYGVYLTKG